MALSSLEFAMHPLFLWLVRLLRRLSRPASPSLDARELHDLGLGEGGLRYWLQRPGRPCRLVDDRRVD